MQMNPSGQFLNHTKPAWLDNNPLIIVGAWEPWSFLARSNNLHDERSFDRYRAAHTREFIQKLAEAGCTLYLGSFWKGLGFVEEKETMDTAAQMAKYCHEAKIRMGVYIGDTLYYESLREEAPECENWAMLDADGDPVTYGQQNWRYRACKNNSDYRVFIKKVIHKAVVECQADMLHFDNVFTEPFSCYCRHCSEGFQKHILTKYPNPEQRYQRFGYRQPVRFVLPRFSKHGKLLQTVPNTRNPVYTEWLDYRCQAMADAIRDLGDYARSLNPEVAVEVNPFGILGHNNALFHAVDHDRLLKSTDVFWSEEPLEAGVRENKLLTSVRSCKLARATGNHLLLYSAVNPNSYNVGLTRGDARIKLAQILAFAYNSAGCVTVCTEDDFELDAASLRYLKFYREKFNLYKNIRSAAKVALWRSSRSLANDSYRSHLSAVLWEQMLMQRHIPFDLVLDSHLANLRDYAVVILPSTRNVTDEQMRLLTRYVEAGGSLVIEGTSGLCNDENVPRCTFPTGTLWEKLGMSAGLVQPRFDRLEKGKVAWVNNPVQHGGVKPANDLAWYDNLFNAFTNNWEIPSNEGELLTALDWAAGGRQLISNAGEYVVFDVVKDTHDRLIIHVVNFKPQTPMPLQIVLAVPSDFNVCRINVLSPDRSQAGEVAIWNRENNHLTIRVENFNVYDVVVIERKDKSKGINP
jgi:hypothetical protein